MQRKASHCYPKMGQDMFKRLPSEIVLNILLRLPIRTTMRSKCVCKPWLDLIETHEFVKSHLSKSASCVAIFLEGEYRKPFKVFELIDELKPTRRVRARDWNMILNFDIPCNGPLYSSVDGLLFVCTQGMMSNDINRYEDIMWPRDLFICNPVVREYIKIPCPLESSFSEPEAQVDTFGFGLSRITSRYKLVRIFHEWVIEEAPPSAELAPAKCQVYTVGTGSWSRIASAGPFKYEGNAKGVFLNGNLHWMVRDFKGSSIWISCFDLETELFSTFSPPPCHHDREEDLSVSSLKDCLCLCDNSAHDEIVIWLMKEYGVEKSWTKEFVVSRNSFEYIARLIWPIKAFNNGDVLLGLEFFHRLLYLSNRTKTILDVDMFGLQNTYWIRAITYTPSFVPLRNYARETVISF